MRQSCARTLGAIMDMARMESVECSIDNQGGRLHVRVSPGKSGQVTKDLIRRIKSQSYVKTVIIAI